MGNDEELINVRLKSKDQEKLAALLEYDGDNVSQVIRVCIRMRHSELVKIGEIESKFESEDEDLAVTIYNQVKKHLIASSLVNDG